MRTGVLGITRLEELLDKIKGIRVLLVGDVCLDAYWIADMQKSSLSRETPHHNLPVIEERYALGGGGNVICNMCCLDAQVVPLTVLGSDWRGEIVRGLLRDLDIDVSSLLTDRARLTPAYIKPHRMGYGNVRYEDPRIDFENTHPLDTATEDKLVERIYSASSTVDVIAVSDQMIAGVVTGRVRNALIDIARSGKTVIVDSRENTALFKNCIVKPNEIEAARATDLTPDCVTPAAYSPVASKVQEITGAGVVVTLGAVGAICLTERGEECFLPAMKVAPPIDIVGAGDSFLSACALALGAGAELEEAVALGNLASAVTIRKIGQTGTASAQEIKDQILTRG